jgi:hypothetical protein
METHCLSLTMLQKQTIASWVAEGETIHLLLDWLTLVLHIRALKKGEDEARESGFKRLIAVTPIKNSIVGA